MPPICLVTKTKLQWGACKAVKKSHSPKRTSFNGDQTIFPPVHNVQNKLLHSTYATPPKTPKLAVNTTRFLKRNRNRSVSFRAIISNKPGLAAAKGWNITCRMSRKILVPTDQAAAASNPRQQETMMVWLAVINWAPRFIKKTSFPYRKTSLN